MLTITNKDILSLENDLFYALVKFSYGKLNDIQAKSIAKEAVKSIDFENSALMHKGVNWYAKQIIDIIDFDVAVTF